MIEISLLPEDYELQDLVTNLELISYKALPNTYKAFKMASSLIMYTWKTYAMGAPIQGSSQRLKNPTGGYAKSIKVRTLAPLTREIYSDSPIAPYLEYGTKEYDMKTTHPYGKRSKINKDGEPYLVIGFRHGTPKSLSYSKLPEDMYNIIRQAIKNDQITFSSVKMGRRKRTPNYEGELIPRAGYKWGTRITNTGVENLEGMVVMDVGTQKSVRSEYFTFRVISVNSPAHKWIQKARSAMHITRYVAENTQDIVKQIVTDGLKKDLGVTE